MKRFYLSWALSLANYTIGILVVSAILAFSVRAQQQPAAEPVGGKAKEANTTVDKSDATKRPDPDPFKLYEFPTHRERFDRYVKDTVGPLRLARTAVAAGLDQWRDSPEEWGQGMKGYGRRYASHFGRNVIQQSVTYGLDEAFGLDTGFQRSGREGVGARVKHAFLETITSRTKSGRRVISAPRLAGVYTGATDFWSHTAGTPGLDVSGTGAGCNQLTGRFTVLEAVYSGNAIVSFAADFEQHCESSTAPPLFGSIRINSTIPLPARPPSAHVSAPSRALEGRSVTLDSAGSGDPQGGALSYAWTQIAGPSVTITNAQSASASFTAPQVVAGGADLTFRLHVTNSLGLSDAATAVVHVADAADARYVLYLDRRPGYPGYGPPTTTITEFDAQFSRYATANPVDWVGFSAYNSPDYFAGDFVAALGRGIPARQARRRFAAAAR